MKLYTGLVILAISLVGCLNTKNRKVEMKRDAAAIHSGLWWRAPVTSATVTAPPDEVFFQDNVIRWPEKMKPAHETGTDRMKKLIKEHEELEKQQKTLPPFPPKEEEDATQEVY